MLPLVVAAGAAYWVLSPKNETKITELPSGDKEIREALHTGFLRSANRGLNNLDSEETRIVRTPEGNIDPRLNAAEWTKYYNKKNNILGYLYGYAQATMDNWQIFRPDYSKKPGLPLLPSEEGFPEWKNLPNMNYDRIHDVTPIENQVELYRDPYGNSGGAPKQGVSYLILNELYYGNPWGVGGPGFQAVGNEYRKAGYYDKPPPEPVLKQNKNKRAIDQMKKRVRFSNNK